MPANFSPVKSCSWSYGLCPDTVVQPGLCPAGVTCRHKTGAYEGLGSVITMAENEGVAVVVAGASGGFISGNRREVYP